MLKNIVKIQYNSDFTLNCKLPNGYDNQDFIIRLYTTDKDDYYEASYLNGEYINCLTDDDNKNVVVYVNNHGLQPGCLHVGLQIDYDNTHFADNVENIITAEETNVYLVKQNANATSAMYVGSALPDLTGSSDFITQSDLEFELLNYYTKEDIDNASYISSSDLNDYVTEEELNDMGFLSQSQLDQMGYTTKDYIDTKTSQKQDRLISAVNIKTINGNSLLGNGNINISGISQDDLDNAIAPLVSQEALTETLSYYVSHAELNSASYATQSFVDGAIADAFEDSDFMTETDVNNLLSTASYVTSSQLSAMGYITNQDLAETLSNATYVTSSELSNAGYVTQSQLNNAGYATETYVSDYVAQHAPTPDLSAYVTKTELSNASYITQSALSNMSYATTSQLPNMNNYVSKTELSNASYITQSALSNMGYLTAIPSEYVTESELSAKSYATTSQLATKQDTLVSGTNIKTVNNNSLLGSGNITISSSGNLIAEVTQAEYDAMQQAGTLDPNTIYVITDAPATDLSYYAELTYVDTYYVSKEQLNSAGYVTASALSNMSYITQSALNSASYATTTQLANKQDTLVSGTNIKTINNESLLGSGNITISGGSGEANVIESISVNGTTQTVTNKNVNITVPTNTNQLTNGAGFLTSAIFQYDSSTYTLTISI